MLGLRLIGSLGSHALNKTQLQIISRMLSILKIQQMVNK